jgi:hypothetical protein
VIRLDEGFEDRVLAAVRANGAYVGKIGCLLCLPLRNAAARLTAQGRLVDKGVINGKQVWVLSESGK